MWPDRILLSLLLIRLTFGFIGRSTATVRSNQLSKTGKPTTDRNPLGGPSATSLHCICIDCKWVTSCAAYHFVETKHEQPHMTENPSFEPRDGSPTIHVNIRNIRTDQERQEEIKRMWREHKRETERAQEKGVEYGEQIYDFAPQVSYEYDVVACEDFVLDKGCWVRNMPEEIRRANPNFVPS